MMTYEERKEIYDHALAKYGSLSQILKTIEEMSELTKVLCKFFCDEGYGKDNLIDELADVTVMVEQMRILFDVNDAVNERVEKKVQRLLYRMEGHCEEPEKTEEPKEPEIVHCRDCMAKKAVPRGDGYVFRCPMSSFDLDLDGYCSSGVRMS